jgi:hypothetical protein
MTPLSRIPGITVDEVKKLEGHFSMVESLWEYVERNPASRMARLAAETGIFPERLKRLAELQALAETDRLKSPLWMREMLTWSIVGLAIVLLLAYWWHPGVSTVVVAAKPIDAYTQITPADIARIPLPKKSGQASGLDAVVGGYVTSPISKGDAIPLPRLKSIKALPTDFATRQLLRLPTKSGSFVPAHSLPMFVCLVVFDRTPPKLPDVLDNIVLLSLDPVGDVTWATFALPSDTAHFTRLLTGSEFVILQSASVPPAEGPPMRCRQP